MSRIGRRRNADGKFAVQYSFKYLAFIWVCSILSVGLLYLAGNALTDSIAAFQSCDTNNTGLSISSCGKQGLNVGDVILFALFAASAALTVSLFTMSWRKTRGRE